MTAGDVYPQPDAPDPVLPTATVLEVVRRHVPGARRITAVDESGGEARVYAIDAGAADVIFKTQRPHRVRPRTSLEKEALFLRHLATVHHETPLSVPHVYGYGREGMLEYLCMSRVPGAALQYVPLRRERRAQALVELGRVLACVHQAPQAPLRDCGLFPGDRTVDDLVARVERAFATAVEALGRARDAWPSADSPEEIAASALRALPHGGSFPPVALHSNPGATHTFVDPRTQCFTGLIDFGDAYLSHPAFDLVRWPDQEDRAAVLEGYRTVGLGVDDAFLASWRIGAILADLQTVARRPEHAARTLRQIHRLLDASLSGHPHV